LFWTYERGTWQYDIMVALILAFIFLTPRNWFQDRPVSPQADILLLSSGPHQKVYQLRAALLGAGTDGTLEEGAQRILTRLTGKSVRVTQIKPERDAEGHVVSYAVWVEE
jgi:hypothetical protein